MSNPATIQHALGKYHCPWKVPQSLLGVTIFSEKLFSHYGLLHFLRHVTIHYPPPLPPTPTP